MKYTTKVLDFLSAQLRSIDKAKIKFKKLDLTDDWSTIYTTNKNTYEIIQNEIDKELGKIAKEVIGKAGFISEIEEERQLARLERSRHFTETFYDVASDWIDRFREVFKSKKELSDEAIVALMRITIGVIDRSSPVYLRVINCIAPLQAQDFSSL